MFLNVLLWKKHEMVQEKLQELDDTNVSQKKQGLKIAGLEELDMADEAWKVIQEAFKK